jgi:16S rRNA (cytosine967-C5)-methyltransferase
MSGNPPRRRGRADNRPYRPASGPGGERRGPPDRRPRRDDRRPDFRRQGGRRPDGNVQPEREAPALPANPREAALRVLHAVDTRSAFSDRMLDGAHARSGPDGRDQALLHELVKGTLRWRGRLDWVLDQRVHLGFARLQPWIRNVLRLGAYQILFLDRIPAHAAVNESVELANQYGHPGAAGLVNGVLRRLADEKDQIQPPEGDDPESLAIWGSHPTWLVERWLPRFGVEATRALLLANNRPARVGLRVNRLRGTREELSARLEAEGVATTPARFSPDLLWLEDGVPIGQLKVLREGWCTAQDESEALVTSLLEPRPHERILDLCAAPGGKCTHIAERMGDEGEVWAMERAEGRVSTLEGTVSRLQTQSVHVVQGDGRSYPFPMPFDRVLVDAPCSGLGVLARRADARWRKGPEILDQMPEIQLELLAAGGRQARPGGVLVYSVCSFEPEETFEVIESFLDRHPGFVLESASGVIPDDLVDPQGFMLVLPHVHGCDGAFAARLRKT